NIPDVATGRALVEAAGRPNGGLCVDSWHFTRGNPDWDALGDLPGELVKGIQINDGTIEPEDPDYLHDCIANRRLCGEGEFDLVRFVQTLDRIGAAEVPYSVEIISDALAQRPAPEVAELTARSTRELLEAARGR
ncbi:MAG: sugar phosphate isomerase/epimerase family protein, partial [Acidimicrobiia bacterium]